MDNFITTADLIAMLQKADPSGKLRVEIDGCFYNDLLIDGDIRAERVSDDCGERVLISDPDAFLNNLGAISRS